MVFALPKSGKIFQCFFLCFFFLLLFCMSRVLLSDTKLVGTDASHRDPSVFGFLEVSSETAYVGTSYGPYRTLNNFRLNPNRTSCWDRAPGDPRGVPWDQKFGLKKFLISSSNELILWVLCIAHMWYRTILQNLMVQLVHHDFRNKWKKEMKNEYPHAIPGRQPFILLHKLMTN